MSHTTRARRNSFAAVVTVAASLVLAGCGSSGGSSDTASPAASSGSASQSAPAEKALIGVSFHGNAQQRWEYEAKAFQDAAAKNGDEAIVNFASDNVTTQANQVQSMLQRGIKVLVIAPADSKAAEPLVKQAQAQGVTVISYDIPIAGSDYFIGRNTTEAGELQAQSIVDAVGCGDIAQIAGDPSIINYQQAVDGWNKVLNATPCIKVVDSMDTKNWDTATAQKNAEAILQKHPDIKGILTMWDGAAQGAIPAVKAAGKNAGDIYLTGIDASAPSLSYIAEGWQGSSVWTPVDQMAVLAADAAHEFSTGATPAKDADVDGIPTKFVKLINVDKNNLCDFVTNIAPAGWTTVEAVYGSGTTTCA